MNALGWLRRRGLLAVTDKLSRVYWSVKSRVYFAPQFGAFGPGSVIRRPMLIRLPGGMFIGQKTRIRNGARLEVVDRPGLPPGKLLIGNHVSIEQNAHIVACNQVSIGDFCVLSANCVIIDSKHPDRAPGNRAELVTSAMEPVHLDSGVFLGAGTTVLPGVHIGENTIVGANSVVTKDLPANVVAAGAPARVVRNL